MMKIIVGVSGSIAAIETIHLCTELRTLGHETYVVMSPSATEIIHPYSFELASNNKVVTKLTGEAEHIRLVEKCDAMIIAPCTANTISKIAMGIGDNALTTTALSALGSIPLAIAPAMHLSLLSNPIVSENLEKLKKYGVIVIDPIIVNNRAKMYGKRCAHIFLNKISKTLRGKKICVVGGAGVEYIDDVRVITNAISSGKTSLELSIRSYILGGDVTLFAGIMQCEIPDYIRKIDFKTLEDLFRHRDEFSTADIIFVPAALPDYKPLTRMSGKFKGEKLYLELVRTERFLAFLREINPSAVIVGFKAEVIEDEEGLVNSGKDLLEKYDLDIVVANKISQVEFDKTTCYLISKDYVEKFTGSKAMLANILIERSLEYARKSS